MTDDESKSNDDSDDTDEQSSDEVGEQPLEALEPALLRSMRKQQERLRDIFDPPFLRSMRKQQELLRGVIHSPALKAMRGQQELLGGVLDSPMLRAVRERRELLGNLLDSPALRAVREQQELLRGVLDPSMLRAARHLHDHIAAPAQDALGLMSTTSFARTAEFFGRGASIVESALRLGHLEHQANTAALAAAGIAKLVPRIAEPNFQPLRDLLDASVDFLESPLEEAPADLVAELPPEVFRALDLDTAMRSEVDAVAQKERADVAARTSEELETTLASLDSALVSLLGGARQALVSENPDKGRHVCVSLRELLGHAIRELAPDSTVAAWTDDPAHFHDGKPTRKARLEYLYGSVVSPPLRRFVEADIRAAIELLDVLSTGTHIANLEASGVGLSLLLTRAEGILAVVLRLGLRRRDGT